jgi:predicted RNA-binding Zn ribbon-like protein
MGKVSAMERVGGHPALDFVNTLGGRPDDPDDEYLFDYADLLTFVAHPIPLIDGETAAVLGDLAARHPRAAATTLERALRLRSALDRVLRARLHDRPPSAADLDVVAHHYAEAMRHAELFWRDTEYLWSWPREGAGTTVDAALWPLATASVDLLRDAPLDRLAQCGHCRWLFLDSSKNRSRRWCSMNACGARMKMRRYRSARQA